MPCSIAVRGQRLRRQLFLLVDTGADRSAIMPRDASRLGVSLSDTTQILGTGFGGAAVGHREWVSIGIAEDGIGEYRFLVEVDVPHGESLLPSVLGRDILDRCRLVYDPMNAILDLEVWRSDDFVPA
jgi:hypothetical protein